MAKREDRRHLSYYHLFEALSQPGCPVCSLVERGGLRFLDALLYERVNDPEARQELRESLGFCNWHAWRSLEVSSGPLGLGMIHHDLLQEILGRLHRIEPPLPPRIPFFRRLRGRGKAGRSLPRLRPEKPCPACRGVRFFEDLYLEILLDSIAEEDFGERFSLSPGICFPHLALAVEKHPGHGNLGLLIRRQVKNWESLRGEVAEFIRKQDYQFAREEAGAESDAWKRAMEMVVGKREVFSNQVRRESGQRENPPLLQSLMERLAERNRGEDPPSLPPAARGSDQKKEGRQEKPSGGKGQTREDSRRIEGLRRQIRRLKKLLRFRDGKPGAGAAGGRERRRRGRKVS